MEMRAFPMQEKGTGTCGAIVRMERCSSGGNISLFCFVCADCAVKAGRASALFFHKNRIAVRAACVPRPILCSNPE